MKANEVPEKIQIHFIKNDYNAWSVRGYSFLEDKQIGMTEYIRTDVFLKKACETLKKCMYDNLMFQGRLHREEVINNFVEDFKNYMKGE